MSSRNLPHHLYVYVDSTFIRKNGKGFEPAVFRIHHEFPHSFQIIVF